MSHLDEAINMLSMPDMLGRLGLHMNSTNKVHCWLHQERTPSMHIYARSKRYKCYGCSADGDVLDIYAYLENIDIRGAVHKLLQITDSNNYNQGQKWLFSKRIGARCAKRYGVQCNDHQVIFPVEGGKNITRNLRGEPRYKFDFGLQKSQMLYPSNWRKGRLLANQSLIVVEGVSDALRLIDAGFVAVAILGSQPSMTQIKMLATAGNIDIMMDGDRAGRNAALYLGQELLNLNFSGQIIVSLLPWNTDPCNLSTPDLLKRQRVGVHKYIAYKEIIAQNGDMDIAKWDTVMRCRHERHARLVIQEFEEL